MRDFFLVALVLVLVVALAMALALAQAAPSPSPLAQATLATSAPPAPAATGGAPQRAAARPAPRISPRRPRAGPQRPESQHIVVDALNMFHWRRPGAAVSAAGVAEVIAEATPLLRRKYSGRVMFVAKDRETAFGDAAARATYQAAAAGGAHVYVAERYEDPPVRRAHTPAHAPAHQPHAARGRDDFYVALLASRWRCAALTNDRQSDFGEFRENVEPFHVWEFVAWRPPARDYIRPSAAAFARLRRPRLVRFEEEAALASLR